MQIDNHSHKMKIDRLLKCVVVGDGAVGKTCLLVSYATSKFPVKHVPTMFDSYAVTVKAAGIPYTLGLFDTAGQEEYDRLRILAYPGTDIFLVCFSVMSPTSLQNIAETWLPELRQHAPKAPLILVGTKVDLRDNISAVQELQGKREKPVTFEDGQKFAKKHQFEAYVECSALTQKRVTDVFNEAILAVLSPKTPENTQHGHFSLIKQCIGR